jgi:hypothetical protein
MRAVAAMVLAICAAACPLPGYADDSGAQQSKDPQPQDLLNLLKQLQALQSANGEAAIMQDGFAAGETIATLSGQPEVTVGLKLLESVLDFTGVFGTTSSNAQTQALTTLTRGLAQVNTEVASLQSAVNQLNVDVGQITNQAQITALLDAQTKLSQFKDQLYPSSYVQGNSPGAGRPAAGGATASAQTTTPENAGSVASQIADELTLFITNERQYFSGEDLKTIPAKYGPKDPTSNNPPPLITPKQVLAAPGLKPNPGLTTYLFGLQLWITAMEIESGGTDSGHNAIKRTQKIQAWLKQHIAFLLSKANAGADPNSPDSAQKALCQINPTLQAPVSPLCGGTIQDRIIKAVSCQWSVHGGAVGSNHPDQNGTCSATLSCRDDIAHTYPKIPPVSITWKQSIRTQQDKDSLCMLDPSGQALTGGVGANGKAVSGGFPSDYLGPMERGLQEVYGLMAMNRMAAMLESVSLYGTAVGFGATAAPCSGCNFGTKDTEPFFVYAVDSSGNLKNYTGYPNKPLPQAVALGSVTSIRALIPGGGTTFYTVTSDGKLNWYQFTPSTGAKPVNGPYGSSKPFSGPVTVASGFNAYAQVFGGGDGVIYAVQSDGTLVWFRHSGFANGGGSSTMTGPKVIASGWGQYKNAFSAGSGILYATQADGSLLWFRHKSYLTGVMETPSAKGTASGTAQTTNAKVVQNVVQNRMDPGRSDATQLEGPIGVGSGWGAFRQVIPSGDGVVLAVQNDGKLLWYRHADYLTGVSTAAPAPAGAGTSVQNKAMEPVAWGTQAAASGQHEGPSGGKSLASSWGAPPSQAAGANAGNAATQRAAMGTAQLGTQPASHVQTGTGSPPSSLHGSSDAAQTLHSGTSAPSGAGAAGSGIGAHQNVEKSAMGVGTAHWEGPATIDAHSGWEGFSEIAAILPVTVQTNVIK